MMDIEVLGTLAAHVNSMSITPTAPKPRHVLARRMSDTR